MSVRKIVATTDRFLERGEIATGIDAERRGSCDTRGRARNSHRKGGLPIGELETDRVAADSRDPA